MLDFDASKLLIIGVVALVVIGPKDLPRVLRQVGQMVGKLRRMAGEFQGQFMDAMKEADLQDLRAEVAKLKDTASLDVDFHPVRDATAELSKAMDGVSTPMGDVGGRGRKDFSFASTPAPATNLVGAGIAPVAEAPTIEPSAELMVLTKPQDASGLPSGEPDASSAEVVVPTEPQDATVLPVPSAEAVALMEPQDSAIFPAPDASTLERPDDMSRPRKVRIAKRRPPGDRMNPAGQRSLAPWRSRSYCPPRREIPTS